MKKTFALIISLLVAVAAFAQKTYNMEYAKILVVTENLRLREDCSTSSGIVTTLQAGSFVKVIEHKNWETIDGFHEKWFHIYTCRGAKDNKGNLLPMNTEGWFFGAWLDKPETVNIPGGEVSPVSKPALITDDATTASQYTFNYGFGSVTLIETHELLWTEGNEPTNDENCSFYPVKKAYVVWNGQYYLVDMIVDQDHYYTNLPDTICASCYKPTATKNGLVVSYFDKGRGGYGCDRFYISAQNGKLFKTSLGTYHIDYVEYSGDGGLKTIDGHDVAFNEYYGKYTLYYLNEGEAESITAVAATNSELYSEPDFESSKTRIPGENNLCLIISDGGIVATEEFIKIGFTDTNRIHWYYVKSMDSDLTGWTYLWEYPER